MRIGLRRFGFCNHLAHLPQAVEAGRLLRAADFGPLTVLRVHRFFHLHRRIFSERDAILDLSIA
jgi:hypothetical protein